MTRDVAVLGCGPAGLLAAHAAFSTGNRVTIISNGATPSKIGGAQFLHCYIPGITQTEPDGKVTFEFFGRPEVYAQKVYGDPSAPTSWLAYEAGDHPVWNMQVAYDNLWERYSRLIVNQYVDWNLIPELVEQFDLVMSCIPAPAICPHRDADGSPTCEFTSQPVWIDEQGGNLPSMTIIYNGRPDFAWYRASNIFGVQFVEYPMHLDGGRRIVKPLWTNCPGPERVERLGRYGQWQKGVLIHDAYFGAMNALQHV